MTSITFKLREWLLGIGAAAAVMLPLSAAAQSATSTEATTSPPIISAIGVTPSSTDAAVAWHTDQAASSQVGYGTEAPVGGVYANYSALDSGQTMQHEVTLSGLLPSTTYHYQVMSQAGMATGTASSTAYSGDRTFMTAASAPTSTATSTGPSSEDVQNFIAQLRIWQQQLQGWITQLLALNTGTGTTTPPAGTGSIDQNGITVASGGSIDFGGHNFGREENIAIARDGTSAGGAFTNSVGSFSTGSMSVPSMAGTYVYTFTGERSGITAQAVVTVY